MGILLNINIFYLEQKNLIKMALKSDKIFTDMAPKMDTLGKDIVKKVGASFIFELRPKKGAAPKYWTINLKDGNGFVKEGKHGKIDATFIMLDDDFVNLVAGKLNPNTAFMTGKMKIKGNMSKAMKFTPDVLPKDAKL